MSSLVFELQTDALNSSVSVLNLLRKALVVAKKLSIQEFEHWIELELNGYTEAESIPKYRFVQGQLRGWNPFHGWQPVVVRDTESIEYYETICNPSIIQPISELTALIQDTNNNNGLHIILAPEIELLLIRSIGRDVHIKLSIGSASIQRIVDAVKDIILRWALQLEKDGIVGEGMSFSPQEKAIASNHSYHIFIENFVGDKSMSNTQNNDFRGANLGGGVAGRDYTGDIIHNNAEKNLAEAAAEIQQLLEQLEKSYPTNTTFEKMTAASEAIKRIESNPELHQKIISALKAGSTQALSQFLNHPLASFIIAAFEDWQKNKDS
jgi:signal recognition particle subunit SEC65